MVFPLRWGSCQLLNLTEVHRIDPLNRKKSKRVWQDLELEVWGWGSDEERQESWFVCARGSLSLVPPIALLSALCFIDFGTPANERNTSSNSSAFSPKFIFSPPPQPDILFGSPVLSCRRILNLLQPISHNFRSPYLSVSLNQPVELQPSCVSLSDASLLI